jgi:DNA repair ATPase RecN
MLMTGEARITELAEMTAGKDFTPTALAQAKELLQIAQKTTVPASSVKKTTAKR